MTAANNRTNAAVQQCGSGLVRSIRAWGFAVVTGFGRVSVPFSHETEFSNYYG